MQSTTNYGLNIVEGTDIVNPLTQFNPNFTNIDSIMKDNADASIDHATCIKTGTVHAVTRTNSDASVFRFTATGNWNTGDTMTVDGGLVSVYLSDGTSPIDGCFVINTEVLAAIQGTRVTLYVNSANANNTFFDNTGTDLASTNVQDAIEEVENNVNTLAAITTATVTNNPTNVQNVYLNKSRKTKNTISIYVVFGLNGTLMANDELFNIGTLKFKSEGTVPIFKNDGTVIAMAAYAENTNSITLLESPSQTATARFIINAYIE